MKEEKWYVVLRGIAPGIYRSGKEANAQVGGVRGSNLRVFGSEEEARSFYEEAVRRGEAAYLDPKGRVLSVVGRPTMLMGYTDGSLKEGDGSASAVLSLEGRTVATGRLALPGVRDSGEAELRAMLLALAMAPRGSYVRLHTDRTDLPLFWGREEPDPWGLVPALKAVAKALSLQVEMVRVPRRQVAQAHEGAEKARQEREKKERESAHLMAFLEGLPPRYRMSALEIMERFVAAGLPTEAFAEWLARGQSETRRLLLEAIRDRKDLPRLLRAVALLDGAARAALKDRDRERAWGEKPPTERQLALLRELGYEGPPPGSVLEASRLIDQLKGGSPKG